MTRDAAAGGPERVTKAESGGSKSDAGCVLLVDDEPLFLRALVRILRSSGHRLLLAEQLDAFETALREPALDVVLLDLRFGIHDGRELLSRIKRERPELEVIVVTGHASVESAVACMRAGAFDYLEKPFGDVHRVRHIVHRAVERRHLVSRNHELERELGERGGSPTLIGQAPAMRSLQRTLTSLRHNESTVLIQGESGTGKELVARALHAASPRQAGPFVPVDCGALPESIIESELFGHQRGAFTGAVGAPGLFRVASGGTLFLDEIGEIPLAVQAKLLRVLQNREVRPLGATQPLAVDLRVVCATHRDLAAMVAAGRFRQDLYYRLNVVRLPLPPLRERREDIPRLAQHFLEQHRQRRSNVRGFTAEALQALAAYDWPGNVRELENTVESALALAVGEQLDVADLLLPSGTASPPAAAVAPTSVVPLSLAAYERAALERALHECGGDASAAARRLGIGRSTFYRKLGVHGIAVTRRSAASSSMQAESRG
jgi:two-component system response regulator HydG